MYRVTKQNLHTPDPGFPWLVLVRSPSLEAQQPRGLDSAGQSGQWSRMRHPRRLPRRVPFIGTWRLRRQNDGVFPDGFNSPRHMYQPWESLKGCSTFLTKGEKIKAARWFQFNRRTRVVLFTAPSLLLITIFIGMLNCWFDHVDASPLGRLPMTIPPLVTRTKRTVDVLRERQEMSKRSLRVVQSARVACSFPIGTSSSSARARKMLWLTWRTSSVAEALVR